MPGKLFELFEFSDLMRLVNDGVLWLVAVWGLPPALSCLRGRSKSRLQQQEIQRGIHAGLKVLTSYFKNL
jgi:hypothetical protein